MSNTQTKKLRTADGTIVYYLDGKMHNLEGPAFIPQGNKRLREYYINGIKTTEEEWKSYKKDGEGIPYYKNGSGNERF